MSTWTVRGVEPRDQQRWRELFAGYRDFYELAPDDAVLSTVWGWLTDADHEVRGLVAVDDTDRPVGLAHVRTFVRPSTASTGLFLDDLFADPAVRGRGVGRALLDAVGRLADAQGSTKVRWITAETNTRARALYDSVASVEWVVYDMTPTDG
ncbi:GNAT family N-acetyltransferase [Rathayibacter sp. CAU 1779]